MTLIGTYIFVILHAEFSIGSAMILMAVSVYFVKCYYWCWVISSFQDVVCSWFASDFIWISNSFFSLLPISIYFQNKQVEVYVMKLITAIPYLKEHHSEYIGLRTALMIMTIRTQFSAKFSCTGIALISVELFGNLINVSYSVIMFLLNMMWGWVYW